MRISPQLSRAARGLLGWTQRNLAAAASVGISTVKNFESDVRGTRRENLDAVRDALEEAGVEFIPAINGKGVGVRMREG
jgi:transcriptional regulator with XRE-family HTH domain